MNLTKQTKEEIFKLSFPIFSKRNICEFNKEMINKIRLSGAKEFKLKEIKYKKVEFLHQEYTIVLYKLNLYSKNRETFYFYKFFIAQPETENLAF